MPTESSALGSEVRGSLLVALIGASAAVAYLASSGPEEALNAIGAEELQTLRAPGWHEQSRQILAAAAKMPEVALRMERLKDQPERAAPSPVATVKASVAASTRRFGDNVLLDPGADGLQPLSARQNKQHIGEFLDPAIPAY